MTIEKKVDLLIHQVNLLKRMINDDGFPFFMFVLNHGFEENQMNAVLKVMVILGCRLEPSMPQDKFNEKTMHIKNNYILVAEESIKNSISDLNEYIELIKNDFVCRNDYKLDIDELFQMNKLPSIEEFKKYTTLILGESFKVKHLLLALKRQHINPSLCEFLLDELDESKL